MKKTYSGNIRKLNEYAGELKKELLGLKIQITPADTPEAKLSFVKLYHGKWDRLDGFSGTVKRLNIMVRFISIKSAILHNHSVTILAGTIPTIEVIAVDKFREIPELIIQAIKGTNIPIDHKETYLGSLKIQAYNTAAVKICEEIFSEGSLKMEKVPTVSVICAEQSIFDKSSLKLEAVNTVIVGIRSTEIITEENVKALTATAEETFINTSFIDKPSAQLESAETVAFGITGSQSIKHSVPTNRWFAPDVDGRTLSVFQVYSGIQNNEVLEIDCVSGNFYFALPVVSDGVMKLYFANEATQNNDVLEVK